MNVWVISTSVVLHALVHASCSSTQTVPCHVWQENPVTYESNFHENTDQDALCCSPLLAAERCWLTKKNEWFPGTLTTSPVPEWKYIKTWVRGNWGGLLKGAITHLSDMFEQRTEHDSLLATRFKAPSPAGSHSPLMCCARCIFQAYADLEKECVILPTTRNTFGPVHTVSPLKNSYIYTFI